MRSSGILMHISSLPGPYGIGTMGKQAYRFVDFLAAAGQHQWQVLPTGPTSYGDSPYQSFSTYAGNPYFIDLETLEEEKLLLPGEAARYDWGGDPSRVDYEKIYQGRAAILYQAYLLGWRRDEAQVVSFEEANRGWLEDYALYMALKRHFQMHSWQEWPADIRLRQPAAIQRYRAQLKNDIRFWTYVQYLYYRQWQALKSYANERGISIIGDIPIYVALDSADVWANPQVFQLDQEGRPRKVAGVPPDDYAQDGQLWGNPLYNWDYLKSTEYRWWMDRMSFLTQMFDRIRIDHFRGFESYYAIPAQEETARNGQWEPGPGMDFFRALKDRVGDFPFIAEDLGYLTPQVLEMVQEAGYPGMKVLHFAFDCWCQSLYLPFRYPHNCVVYTGTHDNQTTRGWFASLIDADRQFCRDYLDLAGDNRIAWKLTALAWSSVADLAIVPMQDLLDLDDDARMNTPSTSAGNWQWRMADGALTDQLAARLRHLTCTYGRI